MLEKGEGSKVVTSGIDVLAIKQVFVGGNR
jgi:hypothetical protein